MVQLETAFSIDPRSGALRCGSFAPVAPRSLLSEFEYSELARASRLVDERGGSSVYALPEMRAGNASVRATIEFNRRVLIGVHLMPSFDGDDEDSARSRSEVEGVALQEAWLREHVGLPSGEHPWGEVWNRLNINASWFDISITYRDPDVS